VGRSEPTLYYPVFLSLRDRSCLVVGGGSVATGKAIGLLAAGAHVRVVAPELSSDLGELLAEGKIEYSARAYEETDLDGMALVMIATNDRGVNASVAADCRRRGIWVNAADDPPNCDFILPSVIRRGKVTLAASTSGASPALARRLREELEEFLSEDFGALADLLGDVRTELQERGLRVDADRWQLAIDDRLRDLLSQRRFEDARRHLLEGLGAESELGKAP
jgi:precorrin-2 dehydrogenase / sirohydrochlorin ferrochelatase